MKLWLAIAGVAALQTQPTPQQPVVAIECVGQTVINAQANVGRRKSDKPEIRTATKTYLIDSDRRTVDIWDEVRGSAVPLCRGYSKCSYDWSPNLIVVSAMSADGMSGVYATVDRREGSVSYTASGPDGDYGFNGTCHRTATPTNDEGRNKF